MSHASLPAAAPTRQLPKRKVPDYLIKEEIDGVPFYYKGYQSVLNKTKTREEIMGCSGLQSIIVEYLVAILIESGKRKTHWLLSNESGNHIALRTNLQFDLAIYEKSTLTADKITRKYISGVPPKVVVEVDLDVELAGTNVDTIEEFVMLKTGKLLDYGTQKVIWVFTKSKKVLVADGPSWTIRDWDNDFEILDGIVFNLAAYLAENGINPDAI